MSYDLLPFFVVVVVVVLRQGVVCVCVGGGGGKEGPSRHSIAAQGAVTHVFLSAKAQQGHAEAQSTLLLESGSNQQVLSLIKTLVCQRYYTCASRQS